MGDIGGGGFGFGEVERLFVIEGDTNLEWLGGVGWRWYGQSTKLPRLPRLDTHWIWEHMEPTYVDAKVAKETKQMEIACILNDKHLELAEAAQKW